MYYNQPPTPELSLRATLANIHRDPHWWRKVLLHGAFVVSGIGAPLAAGFVMESVDNSRKGYPTPLPPGGDWATRYLLGVFALLIDFALFVLPIFLAIVLSLCASVGLLLTGLPDNQGVRGAFALIGLLVGGFMLAMFLLGASPVARLLYADEGRIEEALGAEPVRQALRAPMRGVFWRARLHSLPAYLPALVLGAGLFLIVQRSFPGQFIVFVLGAWLLASALVYAHLVVAQLYVAAEYEIQRQVTDALGLR